MGSGAWGKKRNAACVTPCTKLLAPCHKHLALRDYSGSSITNFAPWGVLSEILHGVRGNTPLRFPTRRGAHAGLEVDAEAVGDAIDIGEVSGNGGDVVYCRVVESCATQRLKIVR